MTLLKMYQHHPHERVFKFIYDSGYLYIVDTRVMVTANYLLLEYVKVPKGYKYETIKNI